MNTPSPHTHINILRLPVYNLSAKNACLASLRINQDREETEWKWEGNRGQLGLLLLYSYSDLSSGHLYFAVYLQYNTAGERKEN